MKKVITISREFGSGGRSIAKKIANQLGYDYFDEEIVKKVAEQTGFATNYIEEQGEYAPGKSRFAYAFNVPGAPGVMDGLSASDFLWSKQREVILKIAERGNCVIVGRCADAILEGRDDVLNVFIHADKKYRAERIVRLYGETDKKPEKRLDEKDKRRKINYNHFTGKNWGEAKNYHITLKSSDVGEDYCVSIITALANAL